MKNEKFNSINATEKEVQQYYDTYWSMKVKKHTIDEKQGFHHGFFEKGIKTPREAIQNMNKLVENLLDLHEMDRKDLLDVGCGIGSTSIYLARKYPGSHFSGITISPVEVKLANEIINKQNLSNAKFILGNFLGTEFPEGSFDSVFALESINHSTNKKYLIREMSRILKPGGKLVVVDWFRTDVPAHSFMQEIYDAWSAGQANITLESRNNFISYLHDEGFKDVQVRDLFANVKRGLFVTFFLWLPIFFPMICKKIIKMEKERSSKEMKDLLALSALDVLIGEGKIAEYLAITAVKK